MIFGFAGNVFAIFGSKELDNEKIAATFAREVELDGYRIITCRLILKFILQTIFPSVPSFPQRSE